MNILLSDILLLIKTIPTFFTTWSIIIFILVIIFKNYLPNFIVLSSKNIILTTSIFGYYLMYTYGHNFLKQYQSFKLIHIKIFNYIIHVLPLFIILIIKEYFFKPIILYDILYSILFTFLIILVYLKLYDIENVYSFTGYKKEKLILIATIIYILCFLIK